LSKRSRNPSNIFGSAFRQHAKADDFGERYVKRILQGRVRTPTKRRQIMTLITSALASRREGASSTLSSQIEKKPRLTERGGPCISPNIHAKEESKSTFDPLPL
jgi:hypothetical protein